MHKIETLLLLSPEQTTEQREQLLQMLSGVIDREGGKLIDIEHWGMRDLAYPVRKQMRGYYVRFEYMAPSPLVAEFERIVRIQDDIYKFLSVRMDEKEAAAPAEEVA